MSMCFYTNAQFYKTEKNIKNQIYILGGISEYDDQLVFENVHSFKNYHAQIGTIFYFNKRKGPVHLGMNWTVVSLNNLGDNAILAGAQIGPELSIKPVKPITLSLGYQYRKYAIYVTDEEFSHALYSAHAFHTFVKFGPLKIKFEYQIAKTIHINHQSEFNPSMMNLGVGFGF